MTDPVRTHLLPSPPDRPDVLTVVSALPDLAASVHRLEQLRAEREADLPMESGTFFRRKLAEGGR